MKTFYHLKEFFREHKLSYIIGVVVLIIVDLCQLVMPRVIGSITDLLKANKLDMNQIMYYIAVILIAALIISLGRFSWRMTIMGASRKLEYWIRNKLFAHLENMSTDFYNNNKTGDLMAYATNDINAIRMAFGPGVVMVVDSVFLTASTIIIMIVNIDLKLTLLALLPMPIIALLISVFGQKVQKRFKIVQEVFGKLTNRVQENFGGIRVVKSFVQEENQLRLFNETNQENLDKNMKLVKLFGFMFPMVMFISSISFVISLGYGGKLVIDNKLSLGQLVSFLTYLGLLTWPMMAIGGVVNMLQRGIASMKRINAVLDTEPEIVDGNVKHMNTIKGDIEIRDLSFKYTENAKEVLSNININVKEGETLAIIGRTGSGKTTLINLLLRMYNIPDNKIFIGGEDINTIPLETLRENIGCVPQENFLFSKTIKENLSISNKNISMENIEKACTISQVQNEVKETPDGFDTILGERGVNLSGGQKQRVSIARAVVKNPKILILDDSLSAVDTNTEENILKGLKEVMKSRTSIIISHRISTIKDADKIIVMDEGKIIEHGTHEELLQYKGLYNDIFEKQQLEEKIKEEE